MFGRDILKKSTLFETIKFPQLIGEGNLVSRWVFFANTPPKHDIYLFNYNKYHSKQ